MRPFALIAACLLLVSVGCESYWERRELQRELRDLEPRQRELRDELQRLTAGKTTFTEEEKARIGPLWIEYRSITDQVDDRHRRLGDLD